MPTVSNYCTHKAESVSILRTWRNAHCASEGMCVPAHRRAPLCRRGFALQCLSRNDFSTCKNTHTETDKIEIKPANSTATISVSYSQDNSYSWLKTTMEILFVFGMRAICWTFSSVMISVPLNLNTADGEGSSAPELLDNLMLLKLMLLALGGGAGSCGDCMLKLGNVLLEQTFCWTH